MSQSATAGECRSVAEPDWVSGCANNVYRHLPPQRLQTVTLHFFVPGLCLEPQCRQNSVSRPSSFCKGPGQGARSPWLSVQWHQPAAFSVIGRIGDSVDMVFLPRLVSSIDWKEFYRRLFRAGKRWERHRGDRSDGKKNGAARGRPRLILSASPFMTATFPSWHSSPYHPASTLYRP